MNYRMRFNRYESSLHDIEDALCQGSTYYTSPEDYLLTLDECTTYIEKLKMGRELNKKWVKRRKQHIEVVVWIVYIAMYIVFILICLFLFPFIDSYVGDLSLLLKIPISVFGGVCWMFLSGILTNLISSFFTIEYNVDLFPVVDEKIEKMFDDIVWKHYVNNIKVKRLLFCK